MIRSALLLLVVVSCVPLSAVAADVVELKTGERVEGALRQATPTSVSIEIGGQVVTFDVAKVRAIYFGVGPALSGSPSSIGTQAAIDALKAVSSVLGAGVTYRDYAARVLEAKVAVDRALPAVTVDELRKALGLASQFYVIVSSAWNAELQTLPVRGRPSHGMQGFAAAGRDPVVQECAPMWDLIQRAEASGEKLRKADATRPKPAGLPAYSPPPKDVSYGMTIAQGKQLLWSCAADKIAEAERLLAK